MIFMSKHKRPLHRSILCGCLSFTVLLCSMLGALTYFNTRQAMYKRYEAYMTDLLKYVSSRLDIEDLKTCLASGVKSQHYQDMQVFFDLIKDTHDIHFLYVIVPLNTTRYDNVKNVIAGMSAYEKEHIPDNEVHLGELTRDQYPVEAVEKYYNAINTSGKITFFDDVAYWGHDYTGVLPLVDKDGRFFAELCVDVLVDEIHRVIIHNITRNVLLTLCVCLISTLAFLSWISKTVVQPIRILEEGTTRFARQSHEQKSIESLVMEMPNIHTDNEVRALAQAIVKMSKDIKRYVINIIQAENQAKELSELANRDALTGIRNKLAYDKEVKKIEWEIGSGNLDYGVAVIDLNFLKRINDTFGHDKGNIAIKKLCALVCTIFDHSPVFRIGGDEFVVIIKGQDFAVVDQLIAKFDKTIAQISEDQTLDYWERISAALGFSRFNPQTDNCFESMFRRADQEMYKRKKAMKAIRQH